MDIDHPYAYSTELHLKNVTESKIITIGHVGSLGIRKNGHLIYSLAERHRRKISNGTLRYWAVGPVEDNVLQYKNSYVTEFSNKEFGQYISREVFDQKIKEIDYAVFLYAQDQFIFRASGTILDVINFTKPIIAMKHPFFDYLTSQVGNIGFLCANLDDMASLISRLAERDEVLLAQYGQQQSNLHKFKQKHSIDSIAEDLRAQLLIK